MTWAIFHGVPAARLSDALARAFAPQVRARGEAYISGLEVEIDRDGRAEAAVQGSREGAYLVRIAPHPRQATLLRAGCTCPVGLDLCKHLWAVLRVVDAAGAWPTDRPLPRAIGVVDPDDLGAPGEGAHLVGAEAPAGPRSAAGTWRARMPPPPVVATTTAPPAPRPGSIEFVVRWSPLPARADGRATTATTLEVVLATPYRDTHTRRGLTDADRDRLVAPGDPALELLAELSAVTLSLPALEFIGYGAPPAPTVQLDVLRRPELWARLSRSGALRLARDNARITTAQALPTPTVGAAAELVVRAEPARGRVRLTGALVSADGTRPLDDVRGTAGALAVLGPIDAPHLIPVAVAGLAGWAALLHGGVELPPAELGELLAIACARQPGPRLELGKIGWAVAPGQVRGRIDVVADGRVLVAQARIMYGDVSVVPGDGAVSVDPTAQAVWTRDGATERTLYQGLAEFGGRLGTAWSVDPRALSTLAERAAAAGWELWYERGRLRASRSVTGRARVKSTIDWFDLELAVDVDGASAGMPELLAALRRGQSVVRLSDGSHALLPSWLTRHAVALASARVHGDALRFSPAEAVVMGALVDATPEASVDAAFRKLRARLDGFAGATPRDAPAGFTATLRPYQREGLGWLAALDELGLGGCLADDMGLGKTVQVLALLAGRPAKRARKPALIVCPRSLLPHWQDEAARFAPRLRVLEWHGPARATHAEALARVDVVVTTYGTLKLDAERLAKTPWDVVVLDEAQAIKNATTATARACRALDARLRLALTGTPIENSLDDLASIFEFLSPGLLGRPAVLRAVAESSATADDRAPQALATTTARALGRTLRPFLLRRTKSEVLTDLPPKTEQVLRCRLEGAERKRYDELRRHLQRQYLPKLDDAGAGRGSFIILEALLRLRQAALHPGLLDPAQVDAPSAKLDALLEHLREALAAGHRALVFSQFTSLLDIVARHLDAAGITHQRLDGKTRDRRGEVARFQAGGAGVFLLSLKAGGAGLNLTAADCVFLLDPWWNPAVEAQAIDRVHRLGQARPVTAYRLVAEDTVEEKVLALQAQKRDLADGLFADAAVVARLSAAELRALL